MKRAAKCASIALLLLPALLAGCARDGQSSRGSAGQDAAALTGSETGTVDPEEASFARQACQTGVAATEIGRLAFTNSKNEAIRDFAKKLVAERSQAEKELAEIFRRKGMRRESALARDLQNSLDRLAASAVFGGSAGSEQTAAGWRDQVRRVFFAGRNRR